MNEIKRGQIIILKNPKFSELEGIVESVEDDRIKIHYSKQYESYAWALAEGDELIAQIHTMFGIKNMESMVLYAPSTDGKLVIENAEAIKVNQKREYVRAAVEFRFFVKKEESLIGALCKDISAGGIKFIPDENIFNIDDEVVLRFLGEEFEKDLNIKAQIIKENAQVIIAKYSQINEFDRDKISKFCQKTLSALG